MRAIRQINRLSRIRNELNEIYLNSLIQTFAFSLIGIFIPIYLIKSGFVLNAVLGYMIIQWAVFAAFSPLVAKLSSTIGLKHTLLARMPVTITFFFVLMYIPGTNLILLFILGFFGGMSTCLYWIPLNSEFVKNTHKVHIGQEISVLLALPRIAGIFAPFMGGAILEFLGFNVLFVLVISLITISVIPLFMTKDYRSAFRFKLKDTRINIGGAFSFSFFIYGLLHMGETLIWPLFIFLTLSDILIVGVASSVSAIGIAFFTILIGKASDKMSKRRLLIMGAIGYSIVWIVRGFSMTIIDVLLLSFMGGLFDSLVHIALFSQFCDLARRNNILSYVASRELWLGFGRVLPLILILVFLVESVFITIFMAAGIICLGLLFFRVPGMANKVVAAPPKIRKGKK